MQTQAESVSREMEEVRNVLLGFVERSNVLNQRHVESLKKGGAWLPDVTDTASIAENRNTNLSITSAIHKMTLKAIDTIERIDQGWEGECTVCGEPIPLERIKISYSSVCVNCQSRIERDLKKRGRR